VTFLVEGSVRRAGDRLRITAQLIEAGTGVHLWADRYDRHLGDVFAVQDEVAQMIASTLFGRIEDAKLQQALRKPTNSMEAHDCFLRGLAHYRSHADYGNQEAAAMLEQAVALDPQYALAQSYLAWVRVAIDGYAAASPAVIDAAFTMASQAVDLDPQESRCHRLLGQICLVRREYDTAERHLRRTIELNPNDADALHQMGFLLTIRGRPEEALQWMAAARRLNPFHPTWYNFGLGIALYSLRRYAEAEQALKQLPNPGAWPRPVLAASCAMQAKMVEARAQVTATLRLRPDFSTETFLQRSILLERAEDRDHLREGLIKAGFPS
jgi:tetratricopeptide (TPR) repeat protein